MDTNLCITNALIEMFVLLYNHNRDYILPVGYHVSYGSVKFAIIDKGAIVESYLMLSDAVLVLKGLALIENGIGYEARAVEVLDDRRGILCLAVLVR